MTLQSPSSDVLVAEVDARAGVARSGAAADAIDGVVPAVVATPATPDALAKTLAWATETGRTVFVRGGGTKLGWAG